MRALLLQQAGDMGPLAEAGIERSLPCTLALLGWKYAKYAQNYLVSPDIQKTHRARDSYGCWQAQVLLQLSWGGVVTVVQDPREQPCISQDGVVFLRSVRRDILRT